jgi:hypothetical protein
MNGGAFKVEGRYIKAAFRGCPDLLGQMKHGRLMLCEATRRGRDARDQMAVIARVRQRLPSTPMQRLIRSAYACSERMLQCLGIFYASDEQAEEAGGWRIVGWRFGERAAALTPGG